MRELPVIKKVSGIDTLMVDGHPFQAFAGEVHNSAAYNLETMEQEIWQKLDENHLNTLIVPIYWETLESVEGVFDYTQVDGLIRLAEQYEKKLILLWFGLWKNAESAYVPAWMKADTKTYFRAEKYGGEKLNTISPVCMEAIERDASAFANLMEHIAKVDDTSAVILVQVENEVGLLGTERDYCPQAETLFREEVPMQFIRQIVKVSPGPDFLSSCKLGGKEFCVDVLRGKTWKEIFDEDAEEIFSAWSFAKALEQIAAAGNKRHPIPYYANVWLKQFPWYPGSYPSGGPVEGMIEVWKAVAPSLSAIAPDIYVPYVPKIMDTYHRTDNPLIIPEVRKDVITASYALYAFMHHHALCYAPFAIEDLWQDEPQEWPKEVIEALKMDPLAFDLTGTKEILREVYRLVNELQAYYLQYRGTNHMQAFLKQGEGESGGYLKFDSCNIEIQYLPQKPGTPVPAGVIFELDKNRFLIVGMMCSLRFHAKAGEHQKVDFLRKESGTFRDGEWICEQRQNGDEKIVSVLYDMPGCLQVELFRY